MSSMAGSRFDSSAARIVRVRSGLIVSGLSASTLSQGTGPTIQWRPLDLEELSGVLPRRGHHFRLYLASMEMKYVGLLGWCWPLWNTDYLSL